MRIYPVACFALFLAQPCQAADMFRVSQGLAIGAHIADAITTEQALARHTARECNVVLGTFSHPVAREAVKFSIVAYEQWLLGKLHDTHPKLATGINLATAGAFVGIALHNGQVIRKGQ